MDLNVANPAGVWALLGLPAILVIHFLQRQSRRINVSTLFLLDPLTRESEQGRVWERLRNSAQLWLQLLAVLLLTWLLVQPLWLKSDSVQRVVIVLDASVSMRPFLATLRAAVRETAERLSRSAQRTEWVLLESDPRGGTLFSGSENARLFSALAEWTPRLGTHDVLPALRVAQSLRRQNGLVLFVSDHVADDLPEGIQILAVGEPLGNCGWAGLHVEMKKNEPRWRALVANYSDAPQERRWWLEVGEQKGAETAVRLEPGQAVSLHGALPADVPAATLVLQADAFDLDDRLPFVAPRAKELTVGQAVHPEIAELVTKVAGTLPEIRAAIEPAGPDLAFQTLYPGEETVHARAAVFFLDETREDSPYFAGTLVAEGDELTDRLNWQGLLARGESSLTLREDDRALLWQGERPLLVLRNQAGAPQLLVNFDIMMSNARRLPAFVLTLHRFIERVRSRKVAPERLNLELNQLLSVAWDPAGKTPVIRLKQAEQRAAGPGRNEASPILRAPAEPAFFEVVQGDTVILDAAAHFADAREADLRPMKSVDGTRQAVADLTRVNSHEDFLAPVWAVLLGAVMLSSWAWPYSRKQ